MEDVAIYPWMTLRGRTYYLRAPVPADLRESLGKAEIWKSLHTQDRRTAINRLRQESAEITDLFEAARRRQAKPLEPPLEELSEVQLKTIHDAYFVHLLEEDDETREGGFEGRDFDQDAEWLETLDADTGCRLAEITGLRVSDIVIDGDTPYIKIATHKGRQLKNASSKRDVPLVGDALVAAREVVTGGDTNLFAFPRYSGPGGPNTASQSLMKWLRKVSTDPLHAVHSLRHNMADRCDLAGVHPTDKAAILGHLNAGASEKHYGSEAVKRVRLKRAMEMAFGIDQTPGGEVRSGGEE